MTGPLGYGIPDLRRRWHAVVTYRTKNGPNPVEHDLAELADLHNLVERGPHWDTIEEIKITRITSEDPAMTVEEAERR